MEALLPYGARHYCGDDCAGILMSSLYCVGLGGKESVDYLLTSTPRSLLANNVCVCVCVFCLMKATGLLLPVRAKPQKDALAAVSVLGLSYPSLT